MNHRIVVTTGDPAGVGPELCVALLQDAMWRPKATWPLIVGDFEQAALSSSARDALSALSIVPTRDRKVAARTKGPTWYDCRELETTAKAGRISAATGRASFGYVMRGLEFVQSGEAAAIVTGPIHKQAWQRAGIPFPGHTEFFVERTGATRHAMMLTSPEITCALVTTHVGIRDVSRLLTRERIMEVLELSHETMRQWLGRPPQLAVLGLNPHAGEGGRFGGGEEEKIIAPAVEAARRKGLAVVGPLSPDTAFLPEKRSRIDAFICMYHDQGLIPLKTLAFDRGVNVTLGLPVVRTSVDHGPALDLAGMGKASPASLIAAYELAERWVTMRNR